jgi:hypothetical protein
VLASSSSLSWTFWSLIHLCELSQTPPTHLLHWFIIQVRLGVILVHLLRFWASSGPCDLVSYGIACYSWWLPPPRWLGAAEESWHELVIVHGHLPVICEGFLGLFPGGAPKVALVNCSWSWVPSSCVGSCRAQVLGKAWCLLAHKPPSEPAFTMGTSVPASMWTSGEKLCVNCLLGLHLVFIIDCLSLVTFGIHLSTSLVFRFLLILSRGSLSSVALLSSVELVS